MAGRARLQALTDELESRTRDYFDLDAADIAIGSVTVPSHLDYVCAAVESGTTTKHLCREMSDTLGYELTYERLSRYLRDKWPETPDALDAARIRASHCMAEQALELVDAPAYDSVSVQQAKNRAAQRNWLAERYNRKAYGSEKGVSVSVSISSLHLSALQATGTVVTGSLTPAQQPIAITSGQPTQVVDTQ